jgi:hypothetical protein
MTNETMADQLLTPGHLYLWGDRLFEANKGSGWSLLYIDRQTGLPSPAAPGVLNGYILVRGIWYEALYKSSDKRDGFTVGAMVDIDLTQFRDLATSGAVDLVDGHIYSNGKLVYQAKRVEEEGVLVWALFRVPIHKGKFLYPIIADSIVGYKQDNRGVWHVLRVGNQYTESQMVLRPCPEFASDILPKLQHVADSSNDYLNQKGL